MSTEGGKLLKEAKKLSWDERLQHKNWKLRNDANINLAALCDSITEPKDARLHEFGSLFKKTAADSKAPVQEKALDAPAAPQRLFSLMSPCSPMPPLVAAPWCHPVDCCSLTPLLATAPGAPSP